MSKTEWFLMVAVGVTIATALFTMAVVLGLYINDYFCW